MNEFILTLILAVVQGIAEWIPVSSSSQLFLISKIFGQDLNLISSVAFHFGTLMAVFAYFRKDIVDILKELLNLNFKSENGRLGVALIIAAIPAGIAGFFLKKIVESFTGNMILMVFGLIITGMFLLVGSFAPKQKNVKMSYGKALIIGLVQMASLFRGISRSGSTIVPALLLGFDEKMAVKFSFLLSIPIVLGANLLSIGNTTLPSSLFIASLVSFFVGISTIHLSFKYILSDRKNLRWFALFVLLEAIAILVLMVL